MAVSIASCEAIWLRKLLVNLFRRRMEATRIFLIIRVASSSLRIQYFMISRSTLLSGVTLSETVSNEGQYS